MPPKKARERVCVLVNRQVWTPYVGACRSREHMHMTYVRAAEIVANGSAHWEEEIWTDGRGKEHHRQVPAIRLNGKKRWKGALSDRLGPAPMKVMQLVTN